MQTIIATTDFSRAANNAVHYAAELALLIHADLVLFHSFQVPIGYMEVPIAVDLDAVQRTAEAEMEKLREKLYEKTKDELSISIVVRMGTFYPELKEICETVHPYAVVMGSQGTTATERILFGSHTVHAMNHLEWPLITVPPRISFEGIKKIGLACDFEQVNSTIPANEIQLLVQDFKAELHVINTGRWDVYNPETAFGSGMVKALLAPIVTQLHFLYDENIDEAIMKFAENNQLDLLIVLPKRHGLIEKMIHKSHAKQLLLHSRIPILSLHPHGKSNPQHG